MNPKQFLQVGGAVLVLVGLLGFLGIIGPTADKSIFGAPWFFTQPENWAHLVLGVVALLASFVLKVGDVQKWLVVVVGLLALIVGLWGFFLQSTIPNFYGANLENPADNILHLVVGAWAIWAGLGGKDEGHIG